MEGMYREPPGLSRARGEPGSLAAAARRWVAEIGSLVKPSRDKTLAEMRNLPDLPADFEPAMANTVQAYLQQAPPSHTKPHSISQLSHA